MIAEFIESWSLFSRTYISALLIGVSLSLMGVVVVARGNVFVAAAVLTPPDVVSQVLLALPMLLLYLVGVGVAFIFDPSRKETQSDSDQDE